MSSGGPSVRDVLCVLWRTIQKGTCDKPLGWIYMSSNDNEATNFDAECGGDSGFERCNSSELREEDDYFDTEQTRQG